MTGFISFLYGSRRVTEAIDTVLTVVCRIQSRTPDLGGGPQPCVAVCRECFLTREVRCLHFFFTRHSPENRDFSNKQTRYVYLRYFGIASIRFESVKVREKFDISKRKCVYFSRGVGRTRRRRSSASSLDVYTSRLQSVCVFVCESARSKRRTPIRIS